MKGRFANALLYDVTEALLVFFKGNNSAAKIFREDIPLILQIKIRNNLQLLALRNETFDGIAQLWKFPDIGMLGWPHFLNFLLRGRKALHIGRTDNESRVLKKLFRRAI